jgi:hypothetical protein
MKVQNNTTSDFSFPITHAGIEEVTDSTICRIEVVVCWEPG